MKFQALSRARLMLGLATAGLSLAGCANVRYDDQHADLQSRMLAVATRFSQTFYRGGMVAVISDIDSCYQDSSLVVVKKFALQDCLSYDYSAYTLDREMARTAYRRPRAPYFLDNVAAPRWANYAKLDGFASPPEMSAYLRTTNDLIFYNLRTPGYILWNSSRPRPPLVSGGGFL